jgi:beta-N-acetylhexosaminidase
MRPRRRTVRAAVLLAAAGVLAGSCSSGVGGTAAPQRPGAASTSAAPGPPTSEQNPAAACAQATLAGMTEQARAGQLFLAGVPVTGPDQATSAMIDRSAPGGVFLFGRGNGGVPAVARVTTAVQRQGSEAARGVGLFVAVDQEGGQIQVLSGPGFSDIPSAGVQGRWTPDQLRASATTWGRELRAAGVNLDLAPVGDVLSPRLGAANAPVGRYDRAFGTQPDVVASHVTAFVQGMQSAGVSTSVKHFPGLGRVRDNTDFAAHVADQETTPNDPALSPFTAGVRAGTTFLMSSSATYTRVDAGNRAVFSRTMLQGLIRGSLGFPGLIISDDLGRAEEVAAVPAGERAVSFLAAGGDVVLTADPRTVGPMVDAVVDRSHRDPQFAALVAAAERRVLDAKAAHGLLPCAPPGR